MTLTGFVDSNIVYKDGVRKGSISFAKGRLKLSPSSNGIKLPDNLFIAPGFIDEHIHGANGKDTMDATIEALETISLALPQEGVTSYNATTMTMGVDDIKKALRNVKEYMSKPRKGARVIGVHLEGPFISKIHKGAQDPSFIRPCDVSLFQEFQEVSGDNIKEVTMAYEEGGEELLAYLVKNNITASLGHSDCCGASFRKAIKEGLSSVTHLFNAMRGFHHREPGIVGTALTNDGVKVEIICDGIHSVPESFALAFKAKKKEDIVLISDSTEGKYLPPGTYSLGGRDVSILDGVARLADGTIAGSVLKINDALRNVSKVAKKYSLSELINLASYNPACNLHMEKEIGSIAEGLRADLVVLDKDFNVYLTIIDGEIAYMKEGFSL